MKHCFAELKEFMRYGQIHQKAICLAALVGLVIFLFGLTYSLPIADHTSAQAGLSLVAGVLGVLLGAVLLVVERLIDQSQQAKSLLRAAYHKYYDLIEDHIEEIDVAREDLINLSDTNQIALDAPVYKEPEGISVKTTYCDVVSNMLVLSFVMDTVGLEEFEEILNKMGLGKKDKDRLLFGRGVSGQYDRAKFLRVVEDALYYPAIAQWCSEKLADLSQKILEGYLQEGVSEALEQLERSRNVLRSRSLGIAIFLLASTMTAAVMALFGTTESTIVSPTHTWLIIIIVTSFFLCLLITLILVEKIFGRP